MPSLAVSIRCARRAWLGLALSLSLPAHAVAQDFTWVYQVGGPLQDDAFVASDGAGIVYVGGTASGDLGGPSAGDSDIWLARYDLAGSPVWKQQFGTSGLELATALLADGAGGVYATGYTSGALFAPFLGGWSDAWITRRSASGAALWSTQLGTFENDGANALALDGAGGVVVGGNTDGSLIGVNPGTGTSDAWLARFDDAGNLIWVRQFGTTEREELTAIASDGAGGVYVGGVTYGDLGAASAGLGDAWFAHYDALGLQLWLRQVGTEADDRVMCAAPDGAGGVYLCGTSQGELMGPLLGSSDVWVARVGPQGIALWGRQFGTAQYDGVLACAPRASGGVYVAGATEGVLGASSKGGVDAWVRLLHTNGETVTSGQYGTPAGDVALGIAVAGPGQVLLSGVSGGNMAGSGPPPPGAEAWFAFEEELCDAGTSYCVASLTSIPGCQASISSAGQPSVSDPEGFTLSSGAIPGITLGLGVFSANGPANYPLGTLGGKACFNPPLFRTAAQSGGGTKGVCDGSLTLTLQDLIDASPVVVPGAVLQVEFWARDPDNADGYLLSNALQFAVCP